MPKKYKLYTDGSCRNNGKKVNIGGWGFIIINPEDEKEFSNSGFEKISTNNRMEVLAMINGLEHIVNNYETFFCEVFTDSAYISNCFEQKWYIDWEKKSWKTSNDKPVKNKDLWEKLIPFFFDKRFIFTKVKGHSGNRWNEEVDSIAKKATDRTNSEVA